MNWFFIIKIYEIMIAAADVFMVYLVMDGLLERRRSENQIRLCYAVAFVGLSILSVLEKGAIVMIYNILTWTLLAYFIYNIRLEKIIFLIGNIFSLLLFAEIVVVFIIQFISHVPIQQLLKDCPERFLAMTFTTVIQFIVLFSLRRYVIRLKKFMKNDSVQHILPLLLGEILAVGAGIYFIQMKINGKGIAIEGWFVLVTLFYMIIVAGWYLGRLHLYYQREASQQIANYAYKMNVDYVKALEDNQHETDAIWHDIKKHLAVMEQLQQQNASEEATLYLENLQKDIDQRVVKVDTGISILNVLLVDQIKRAKQAQIAYRPDIRLIEDLKIEPMTLCIILGNLFDNALEACMALPEAERRIKCQIKQRQALCICMSNTYDESQPKPSRPGKHGIGLLNVRKAVEDRRGEMTIKQEGAYYTVELLIP